MLINLLKQTAKTILFKAKYAGRSKNVTIPISCTVGVGSIFEGYNKLGERTRFKGQLGLCSYIGSNCSIYGKVGGFCSISSNVNVLIGSHPTGIYVSSSPVFYTTSKQCGISFTNQLEYEQILYADKEKKYNVIIGNDVWIGYGATIIAGITIGDGAIIATNATVTRDVPPYTIVGGNPAKPIKKRFTDKEIDFLLEFKWWDKDIKWLKENSNKLLNIEEFITKTRGVD